MPALDIQSLAVHFGAIHACDGIDLQIDPGEIVGIVGPNGSGKTTLLKAICGEARVASGNVIWHGQVITGWPADRISQHGLVRTFQQSMMFASATVRENLKMATVCRSGARRSARAATPLPDIPAEVDDILTFTGLDEVAGMLGGALSTGWLRVLGIALALATRPSMLLLDEPAAGLSVARATRILTLLRRINAAGVTLAIVDHDLSFLLPVCSRLLVLDSGRKLADGSPGEVVKRPDVLDVYLGGRFAQGRTAVASAREAMSREGLDDLMGSLEVPDGEGTRSSKTAASDLAAPAVPPDGTSESKGLVLEVEAVSVRFGGVQAVTEASIKVNAGEIVAVLGPNGAGKSVLLKSIVGAVRPDAGRVRVDGRDVTGLRPDQMLRRGVAQVLEGRHVFGGMTVAENLRLGATIWPDSPQVGEGIDRLYQHFPALFEKRDQPAMLLSGGQQQVLVIARALLSRPKILFLDEPSLGLAPMTLDLVASIVTWANHHLGIAIVMVEQHAALALSIADRCYVMARGRVVLEAPSADLLDGTVLQRTYLESGVLQA